MFPDCIGIPSAYGQGPPVQPKDVYNIAMPTARKLSRPLARVLHLAFLSFFLTPLVPSVAAALAHLKNRELKAFILSACVLVATTSGELIFAFGLTVTWAVYLMLHLAISIATGLLLVLAGGGGRRGSDALSHQENAGLPSLPAWGLLLAVAASPLALSMSYFATRWGSKADLKPSFAGVVLLISIVVFLPIGIGAGWVVRRRKIGSSMATALAVLTSFTAVPLPFLIGVVLADTFGEKVLKLSENARTVYYSNAAIVQGLLFASLVLIAVWLFFYVSSVRTFSAFFFRLLLIVPIGMGFFFQHVMLDNSYPESWHYQRGVKELGRRDWEQAARTFKWTVKRRLSYPTNATDIENLFIIALSTRDVRLWKTAEDYADRFRGYSSGIAILDDGAHGVPSPLQHIDTIMLSLPPVKPRTYLNNDWCAFITAVAGSLPKASETELLFRLRSLSSSAGKISLPSNGDVVDLRTAAAFYGLAPVPVHFDDVRQSLKDGVPLLFEDPVRETWGVIVGFDPQTRAILWYDYASYNRGRSSPLSRREIQRIVSGKGGASGGKKRVYAETIRASFLPLLRERMLADADTLFVLRKNPTEEEKHALDTWIRRDLARRAIKAGDAERFRALLSPLHSKYGWARAMMILPDTVDAPEGRGAASSPLTDDLVDRMDIWTLRFVARRLLRDLPADPGTAFHVFQRLARYDRIHGWVSYWLMHMASKTGDEGPAVKGARRYARNNGYSSGSVQTALGDLAALRHPGGPAKQEMARLVGHLPLFVEGRDDISHLLLWSPSYCAAKAVLAASPRSSARWWKRAVDLEPTNAAYLLNYADILSSMGLKEESGRMVRRASSLGVGARS